MRISLKLMALSFSAGCVGGLSNSVVVWLAGAVGITASLGVSIAPAFTPDWLYPRVVWGGLWGFLFILPLLKTSPCVRGLTFSAGPTAVQLLIIFPYVANKGFFGLGLGTLTPVFVVIFNAVWGLAAAAMLKRFDREPVAVT